MTKREECFKIFAENLGADRKHAINLVVSKVGVTQTTAQTYYPAWRNEYMGKPVLKQEKAKNITKNTEIIIEKVNKITEAAEKSPIKAIDAPEPKPTFTEMTEAIKDIKVEEINWKANATNPVEVAEEKEDIFEITRLLPVVMLGKYGTYNFDKEGVRATARCENLITKDGIEETQEALAIWERCYRNGSIQVC